MKTRRRRAQVGMSEDELREVNDIPPRMLVKAGSTLLVPRGSAARTADVSERRSPTTRRWRSPPRRRRCARLTLKAGKKGDSVAAVAKRYRVSAAQVAQWNTVAPGASFAPGQTIVVYTRRIRKGGAQDTRAASATPEGRAADVDRRQASGKHRDRRKTARAGKATARSTRAPGTERLAERRRVQRRSTRACAMVPRSTYSSSLPTGTPRARRVTRTPRARSASPSTCAVASPSAVKSGGEDHLLDDAVAGAFEQLAATPMSRGADAVERAEPAHQHEVQAAVAAGALQRRLVGRRLDHAQRPRVAARVEADAADRLPR